MSKVSRVAAAMCVTALTGALTMTSVPSPSSAAVVARRDPPPTSFTISSFNVLGASHTPAGSGRASGATRIVRANRLLKRHHVDVAGFQEMQVSQLTTFMSITHDKWAVYPGRQLRTLDSENSIGWRKDKFDLLQATTVTIPYFNGGPRAMPLVLLREKSTGMMAYVANYHNPAETAKYHHQGRWRAEATRIEIALQKQLVRTYIPRFVTGDMNERAEYFCRFAREAPVKAARPGTHYRKGVCNADRPRAVDWILGSKRVRFSNYNEDRTHLVDITTDHPVITSTVTVDPKRMPHAWDATPPAPIVPKVHY